MSRCSHVSTAQGRSREPSTVPRSSSRASSAAGASDSDDGSVASTRGPPESARSVGLQNPRIAILGVAQPTGRNIVQPLAADAQLELLARLASRLVSNDVPADIRHGLDHGIYGIIRVNLDTDNNNNNIAYMPRDASPTPRTVDKWIAGAAQHFSNDNSGACRRCRRVGRFRDVSYISSAVATLPIMSLRESALFNNKIGPGIRQRRIAAQRHQLEDLVTYRPWADGELEDWLGGRVQESHGCGN